VGNATALKVDQTNTEQARAWDGDEGAYWTDHAQHFDRSLGTYHERFLAAADIRGDDRVLDIGCGTGQTTRDAARRAQDGTALGVDLSNKMISLARRIATSEGVANAHFEQADAQIHSFGTEPFDVAVSRTGTMFFGDPVAAFTNIARVVRPGGRIVLLVWQGPEANEWIRELNDALVAGRDLSSPPVGAPGPFAQSDPEQVQDLLSAAGFCDVAIEGWSGPMWFGADAQDAYGFIVGLMSWMLEGLDVDVRELALGTLRETVDNHSTSSGVTFGSATWLITASRI
jgi:ubiquinone/menaquinone biosynthesis C-methylase UbiE